MQPLVNSWSNPVKVRNTQVTHLVNSQSNTTPVKRKAYVGVPDGRQDGNLPLEKLLECRMRGARPAAHAAGRAAAAAAAAAVCIRHVQTLDGHLDGWWEQAGGLKLLS